jgi:hypothetical protein
MFLTLEEIERLTGYKRRRQQCEILVGMHIPFRVNARGEPIVSAAVINGQVKATPNKTWQPNLN